MFSDLFDFEKERSGLQALGFYIAFLLMFMIIGVIVTVTGLAFFRPESDEAIRTAALNIGKTVAFIGSNLICLAIGVRKGYRFHYLTLLMMFLSGTLAFLLGALGGLVPTALFTTFRKKTSVPPAGDREASPTEP